MKVSIAHPIQYSRAINLIAATDFGASGEEVKVPIEDIIRATGDAHMVIAEDGGEMVGAFAFKFIDRDYWLDLPGGKKGIKLERGFTYGYLLAVRPDYRGQGLGRRIVATCFEQLFDGGSARSSYMVVTSRSHVLPFWAGLGFTDWHRAPGFLYWLPSTDLNRERMRQLLVQAAKMEKTVG